MGWAVEPNSFIRIYDYSRRKGKRIDPLFFSTEMGEYVKIRNSFRVLFEKVLSNQQQSIVIQRHVFETTCNNYISVDKVNELFPNGALNSTFDKKSIKLVMHLLADVKNSIVRDKLSSLVASISTNGFAWQLDLTKRIRKGKDVYSLDSKDIGSFFMSRLIQQSIKERYRIVMSNRSTIVKQVFELITMNSPFSIIRTDIQGFFESVPHTDLVNMLEESKLPQSQIVAVCDLLEKCHSQFGNSGLPRGIGLSSYLAELFLLDFDRCVKKMDSVIYYNRYVDDIIVVVSEDNYGKQNNADRVKTEMISLISSKKLSFHSGDSKDLTITNPPKDNSTTSFDYLGYEYSLTNNTVKMDISDSKIEKYKERINYAAWSYWNTPSMNRKERNQLFIDRIKFLSMKTRLNYDKKNVLTGLPSRYPLIEKNSNSLNVLDGWLSEVCKKMPPQIKNSVGFSKNISFKNGFSSNKVLKFKEPYLKEITRIWKSL